MMFFILLLCLALNAALAGDLLHHVHSFALPCAESGRAVRGYTLLRYHVQGSGVPPTTRCTSSARVLDYLRPS